MGTPDFAVPSLEALVDSGYAVVAVVTQPDRPRGRGRKPGSSPVKSVASALGLDVLQPERVSDAEFRAEIIGRSPDVIVVVAFGQLLTRPLLEAAPLGAVNLHASLLPKYRGAAPINWVVINGETTTGLTAMRLDEGMDTGPVLLQEELGIDSSDTAGTLHDRLALKSAGFLIKTLEGLAGGILGELPQDDSLATYAPKIDRSVRRISWSEPAEKICALIRGLDPVPGAVTTLEGRDLKIFSPVSRVKGTTGAEPGVITCCGSGLLEVAAGKGSVRIGSIQMAGRKRLPVGELLCGMSL
ncbi:MAG TPA: methionyl-tRNA formyltransferase, partial [Desulfobacteraceae bacterium]|nr:methionyl-tRNA formyltransferase [Desulfobacteraceae bacterium]